MPIFPTDAVGKEQKQAPDLTIRLECRDCGPGTTIIEDRGEGFNVCLKCGVVCGSQIIDETAEHRVFADDAQTGRGDPSRVTHLDALLQKHLITASGTTIGPSSSIHTKALQAANKKLGSDVEEKIKDGWALLDCLTVEHEIRANTIRAAKDFYATAVKAEDFPHHSTQRDALLGACLMRGSIEVANAEHFAWKDLANLFFGVDAQQIRGAFDELKKQVPWKEVPNDPSLSVEVAERERTTRYGRIMEADLTTAAESFSETFIQFSVSVFTAGRAGVMLQLNRSPEPRSLYAAACRAALAIGQSNELDTSQWPAKEAIASLFKLSQDSIDVYARLFKKAYQNGDLNGVVERLKKPRIMGKTQQILERIREREMSSICNANGKRRAI